MAADYQMTINFSSALFKALLEYLKPQKNEKILDIGCNEGYYVKRIEDYTENVLGIDASERAVREAVTSKVEIGDAISLRFESESFDKIYSLNVIEHMSDVSKFLSEATRVLKTGGEMIIVYPMEPVRGIQAIWPAIRNYGNPFLAGKIHLHRLTPSKIKKIIIGTSLRHIDSRFVFGLTEFHYI